MLNWFVKWDNIDWTRLWVVTGTITIFWAGLATITIFIPKFDPYYKVINVLLSATTGALLFASRGGKYVKDRTELPPADGKP